MRPVYVLKEGTLTGKPDNNNDTELKPENIARGDPLLRWLSRIEISPIVIGIAYTVLLNLARGLAAWRAGYLRTSGTATGFFDDPSVYTNLVYGAVMFAYYAWMPRGIVAVFAGIQESNVIGEPTPTARNKKGDKYDYASLIKDMQSWFGKWWWPAISLAIATTVTFTLVLPQYLALGQSAWWTADTLPLITALLWALIGIYCVLLLLFYTTFSIIWLSRLFKDFTTFVRPLYPDRAGGLASLGNFTLRLSYIIALVGVMLVVTPITRNYVVLGTVQFRWTTELLTGLIAYVIAAPIVFFAPLGVAHEAMRKAKHQQLLKIAKQFDEVYENLQEGLDDKPSNLEHHSRVLKELQELHKMTSKFPVWPFNLENVTRFLTAYVLPIVVPLVLELFLLVLNQ